MALDRKIARSLDRFPVLRRLGKSVYQRIVCFPLVLRARRNPLQCTFPLLSVSPAESEAEAEQTFFGYYNLAQWSPDIQFLAAYRLSSQGLHLALQEFRRDHPETIRRFPIEAWNWQQGCFAQWDPSGSLCWNTVKDGRLVMASHHPECQTTRHHPLPLQALNREHDAYYSIDYHRLHHLGSEYGLAARNPYWTDHSDVAVAAVDLRNDRIDPLISFEQITQHLDDEARRNRERLFVNHLSVAPGGNAVLFITRYEAKRGRRSTLFCLNTTTGSIHPALDERYVSHYCWLDDHRYLVYGRHHGADAYHVGNVDGGQFERLAPGDISALGDGHPSISPDGHWLVFDSYPDRSRMSSLYLRSLSTGQDYLVGRFFHPFRFFGAKRCDLHPRWSPDSKLLSIDTVCHNQRRNLIIDVSELTSPRP